MSVPVFWNTMPVRLTCMCGRRSACSHHWHVGRKTMKMEATSSCETSALTYQCGSLCSQQEKVYFSLRFNFYIRTEREYRPKIRYGGNTVC